MRFRETGRALLLGAALFVPLFAGFHGNAWRAASDDFFATAQKDTEALVFGRLLASRDLGFFSGAGLVGFAGDHPLLTFDTDELWRSYRPAAQVQAYLERAPVRHFAPYFTHTGLQGRALAILDRVLAFLPPARRLAVFVTLTAALVAAFHAVILVFLRRELGVVAALFALALVLLSPWLAAFGRNLYWQIWLFWLPALAVVPVLLARDRHETRCLLAASFLAFLVRFAAGYEYATVSAGMAGLAVVYCTLRDRAGPVALLRRTAIVAVACVLSVIASLGILTFQIGRVTGSPRDAVKHLAFAIGRRAHGDPERLPPVYAAGLRARTGDVVRKYLDDPFDRDAGRRAPLLRPLVRLRYRDLAVAVAAAAVWIALRTRWLPAGRRYRPLGLAAAAALAFLGVMAWHVVFKAHSFIHLHVNPLMWHLAFLPLGAALVGFAVEDAGRLAVSALRRR